MGVIIKVGSQGKTIEYCVWLYVSQALIEV